MSDLISRQDAIDATWRETEYADPINVATAIRDRIEALPSTEIVQCKDCKHFEYDHPYIIQGIPVLGHEVCNAWGDGCKTDENGYCFMAERRQDADKQTGCD